MIIELMIVGGVVAGFAVGLWVRREGLGCLMLLAVPAAVFVYIAAWQAANPDKLRSTSGLDFMFGMLWPSLGVMIGLPVGRGLRSLLNWR